MDKAPVKLALDLRAEGIASTLVGNVEEAADCFAHTRYRPHGRRNWDRSWRTRAAVSISRLPAATPRPQVTNATTGTRAVQ